MHDWQTRERVLKGLLSLTKFERIQAIGGWGLNIPNSIFFERNSKKLSRIRPTKDHISVRCYTSKEDREFGRPPLFAHQPTKEILRKLPKLNQTYDLMVDLDPINPQDTLFCGNIRLELHSIDGFGICHFFVCRGPGTVRDIEQRGVTLECNLHGNCYWDGQIIPELTRVKFLLMRNCPYWNGLIYEFCVYPHQVGVRREPIIFWEVRRFR